MITTVAEMIFDLLQGIAGELEMKKYPEKLENAVFWDVMPVALVITEVSVQRIACIIRVIRIVELGTTLAVTSNRSTLRSNDSVASYC
jgi:hypothetical protein